MTIYLSLFICLLGLLLYGWSNNGKVQAVSLNMFWVGLLVFLASYVKVLHA